MTKVGRVVLQGESRGFKSLLLLFLVFYITTSGSLAHSADGSPGCERFIARVVSIQGQVESKRAGQNGWTTVTRLDAPLCDGDSLRTGPLSRSALFVQPESLVRVDQNTTLTIGQTADETLIEFRQDDYIKTDVRQHCGAGYFISRFPKKFRVNTPFFNAAVEGTEFLVAMRCESAELSVVEGKVLASSVDANVFPAQTVTGGQTLTVGGGEAPAIKLLIKPADAVQWTLYYPPITPAGTVVAEDCQTVPQAERGACLIARAENFLRAGRVEEAQQSINDAVAVAPNSSDAKALNSIITLVKNDKGESLRLAKETSDASPNSAPAWLALSYAQQADFKLEAALASAKHAADLTPSSALALARVAELQLSLGWSREAEKTANAAVAASPSESRAHMILGFVHLAQIKVKEARENFERAIELDSTEPLSRLGLGLAIIRKGKLEQGREQIEIAVALDPTNSLIRSYVGKAYYEENSKERDQLASSQFWLAKQLDNNDPTPWFYDAILKQTQNQPNEALKDLQDSIRLNDNRAVNRSRFLLDQDRAARSENLAQTYRDLTFDQLALSEASKSLAADSVNSSAHRLLADAYVTLPRHDVARESELLQSQLTQPLAINPITPLRTQDSFGFLPSAGITRGLAPTRVGMTEFAPLFERNQAVLFVDALGASKDTWLDQVVGSVLTDSAALNIAQGHFETAGFEENKDFRQNAYYLFGQVSPSDNIALQGELSRYEIDRGDTLTPFDPAQALPLRIVDNVTRMRIGAKLDLSPNSSLLLSGISQSRDLTITFTPDIAFATELNALTAEARYSTVVKSIGLTGGAGYLETVLGPGPEIKSSYSNYYLYSLIPLSTLKLTLGLSETDIDRLGFVTHDTNPKLGFLWTPTDGTTIRGAVFQTVKAELIGKQTIEPTQVAGFNQFFDDPTGARSRLYGIGVDQTLSSSIMIGAEVYEREISVPVTGLGFVEHFEWRENLARTYAYWNVPKISPRWSSALTAEYYFEKLSRPEELTGVEGIRSLTTHYVPLGVVFFVGEAFSAKVTSTFVRQNGQLQAFPGDEVFLIDEKFWVTDAAFNYILPRRRGRFEVGAKNLLDRGLVGYQDSDPATPRFSRGRLLYGRFTLNF